MMVHYSEWFISLSYSSVRKLVKLESVQFILENHTVSQCIVPKPICGTYITYPGSRLDHVHVQYM